mmetsp:Transcript_3342/g.4525  ORF Transcript_3342/g.4525 Transcript_3342/m.4525 type:complete len:87 (-) Transcript_3342:256-516(-)
MKPKPVAVEDERPPPNNAVPVDELDGDDLQHALDSNFAEMDELMGDMGLNSDDEGEAEAGTDGAGAVASGGYEEGEDLDDDDIDLR